MTVDNSCFIILYCFIWFLFSCVIAIMVTLLLYNSDNKKRLGSVSLVIQHAMASSIYVRLADLCSHQLDKLLVWLSHHVVSQLLNITNSFYRELPDFLD